LTRIKGNGGASAQYANMTIRLILLAFTILFAPHVAVAAGVASRGRMIAVRYCSPCHAIGLKGDSPNHKSPPFRTISQRYPIMDLEEALGEGIMVGHEGLEMPMFSFEPADVEDLLAYLRSIQTRKRK